jgi:hypothetical protein
MNDFIQHVTQRREAAKNDKKAFLGGLARNNYSSLLTIQGTKEIFKGFSLWALCLCGEKRSSQFYYTIYAFMPLVATPCRIFLRNKKKTTTMGMIVMTAPAIYRQFTESRSVWI